MAELAVEAYGELLLRSGLVVRADLDRMLSELSAMDTHGTSDSSVLAQQLLSSKIITPWQHNRLLKGHTSGFFLGNYKLLAHLGSGGMSTVYLAEHRVMERRAAIKVLHHQLCENATYLERFYQEARATASLDHPSVVRAYDIDTDGDVHYLVMEYVEGSTLQKLVDKLGPLPCQKAADYVRQAAAALEHAHKRGLIHRDVKPDNLVLTPRGAVKVLDLGMARLTQREAASITLKNQESMLGTADYLAPEQIVDCHEVDGRADIYGLGCTLYCLLTGHPPFNHGTIAMRLMMHQVEEAENVSELRPEVPQALADICHRMIAKQPEDRPATMGDVVLELGRWLVETERAESGGSNVISGRQRTATEDDTLADAAPYTVLGIGDPAPPPRSDGTAGSSRPKVNCPACGASYWAPPQASNWRAKCPKCSATIIVAGAHSQTQSAKPRGPQHVTKLPTDVTKWRFAHYQLALLSGDVLLLEAVNDLHVRYPGNDKVAVFLTRLLAAVGLGRGDPHQMPVLKRTSLAHVIDILAASATTSANETLAQMICGRFPLGPNADTASQLSAETFLQRATEEREEFVVQMLTGEGHPLAAGVKSTPALRARIGEALAKNCTRRVKNLLRARMTQRNLPPDVKTMIYKLVAK